MEVLKGTPISPGIAIGKVKLVAQVKTEIILKEQMNSEEEKRRFHQARNEAIEQVKGIYEEVFQSKGEKEAEIFSAHISIMEDIELIDSVDDLLDDLKCNAEWALKNGSDSFIEIFRAMDNEYMRERAMDIKDISDRIQRLLAGHKTSSAFSIQEPAIIVAHELTPSDTAALKPELVLGIVNAEGGPTSHAAIIARMMGVPLVVFANILDCAEDGKLMVFDGAEGSIYLEPSDEILLQYQDKREIFLKKKADLLKLKGTKAITTDGFEMILAANIGAPKDVNRVLDNDADGIGLFRTEFLYMSRDDFPDEEEQFEAYKEVAERIDGPVVIRTLDIGGDKELDYLEIPKEMNPFLGCRAIRFCLKKVDLWKIQLRALLRASSFGDVHIMFPMIAAIEELDQAKAILEEVKAELREKNIGFNEKVPVGMMMETPAAAVMADVFAGEVDFFSIGTNDLIQYTMAVDRMNSEVAHLYSQYDPAVLRLIKKISDSGHEAGIWVGICGEAAADPNLLPLWVGMGIDELSMTPVAILETRERIQGLSEKSCEQLTLEVLKLRSAKAIKEKLEKMNDRNL